MFRIQTSEADYVSYDIVEEVLCYFVKTPVMRWREGCSRGLRWTEGSSCPLGHLLLVDLGGEKNMTNALQLCNTEVTNYLVTTQSVGRGRRVMQGRKGAPWRRSVPRRAKKVEPRCLGSPPMRGRKDPERQHQALFPVIIRCGHLVWGGKGLQRGRG